MVRRQRFTRVVAGFVAMVAVSMGATSEARALTSWTDFGKAVGYLSPWDSRLDVASITFQDPQAIRVRFAGTAPRAKVYVEGNCRRPDGSWTKRVETEAVVRLPYTTDVTSLLNPVGKVECWVWATAFPRTRDNSGVTMRITLQAKYED